MTNLPGLEHIIEITYLIATALFILSLKWLSSPTTARRGVFAGELGMLLAIAGTLLHHGIVEYKWIVIALVLGTIIGVPLGNVAMTAVRRILLAHSGCAPLHDGRAFTRSHPWLADLHRQLDGRGEIAGGIAAAAHHL